MAFCKSCGSPLEGAGKFCVRCGQPVGQPEAVAPETAAPLAAAPAIEPVAATPPEATYAAPVPPPAYVPPAGPPPVAAYPPPQPYTPPAAYTQQGAYPQGAYPQGAWPPSQRRSSLKWLWISLGAVVVVAAIALVLVFVVFKGGESAGATPEQTVERLFTAMENKDLDTFLDLMDPSMKESLPSGDLLEAAKDEIRDEMFDFDSVKFSNIEMSTEKTSDTTATVTITEGTVEMTVDGEAEANDVNEADEPVTFELTKIDGKWYLDSGMFF
jgi:hypothetical protein